MKGSLNLQITSIIIYHQIRAVTDGFTSNGSFYPLLLALKNTVTGSPATRPSGIAPSIKCMTGQWCIGLVLICLLAAMGKLLWIPSTLDSGTPQSWPLGKSLMYRTNGQWLVMGSCQSSEGSVLDQWSPLLFDCQHYLRAHCWDYFYF